MKVTDSVDSFYTRVTGLISKLKSYGENIEEIRVVEKFRRSLPQIIESLVITLEENKYVSQFTLDELQTSLINHEHRINRSNTSLEDTFVAQSSISHGRGTGRYNSRGRGISFLRGGHNKSPANVSSRGENHNPSHPKWSEV